MLPAMQIYSIQFLRFFAVFLVLGSHIVLEIWHRYANDGRYQFWHDFGGVGVDIFFVISGVVITLSTIKALKSPGPAQAWLFCKRRIIRIVPMYWFYSSLKAVMIVALGSNAFKAGLDPVFFLKSIFFFPVINPAGQRLPVLESGWTLSFEMLFYASFALALLVKRPPLRLSLVLLGILYLVCRAFPEVLFCEFFGRSLLFEFLLGGAIAHLWLRRTVLHPVLPPLLVAVGLGVMFMPGKPAELDRLFSVGVPAAMLVMGAMWLERYALVSQLSARFKLLGDASYAIYLSHGLIVPVIVIVLQKLRVQDTVLVFVVTMLVSLVLGCLAYLWLEQPLTNWLNRRFGAGKAAPAAPAVEVAR